MAWELWKLGTVCSFENGDRGKNYPSKSKFVDSGVPFVNAGHLDNAKIQLSEMNYITEEHFELLSRGKFFNGDILFCLRGSLGKCAIVNDLEQGAIASSLVILRPNEPLNSQFLLYYLQSPLCHQMIQKYKGGAAQPNLGAKDLEKFLVPIPDLSTQKEVVKKLDKAFADIEQARANTEQNLRNARELFDSYLQQVFSERGDDWEETNLGAISELKNGLNYTQASKGELVKIVGVKNFKDKFYISNDELETIQIDGTLSEAYHAKDGDIFIVRSNGNKALIGRSVLAKGVTGKVSHSGFTIRVRLSSSAILPSYLTHYLKSKHVHNLLIRSGEGANISSLNQKALASLPVCFPKKNEQLRLVHDIEAIQSKTMALVDVYEQKLAALDELKQSLLQQAFTGQLTQG